MQTSRIQLALNVTDVKAATEYYSKLFGVGPSKEREGYANFAVSDPPLKLILFEDAGAGSALNHLGVELATSDDVVAETERFDQVGLTTRVSRQEMCCHAVQDKVYVTASDVPLGQWEFYTVLDDDPDGNLADASETCCPTSPVGAELSGAS